MAIQVKIRNRVNQLAEIYLFPDALLALSGRNNADSTAFVFLGAAMGVLILCSLARLHRLRLLDLKDSHPKEYRYRIAAAVSILTIALGMGFPFIPVFFEIPIGSILQFLGFLGFELSLGLVLLLYCFPRWGWKQLLPLPMLTVITALLPFFNLHAAFALSCFSFALGGLCILMFFYSVKQKQPGNLYLWGTGLFLAPGLSFLLPTDINAFFWPAAFLAYLLLEHDLFPAKIQAAPDSAASNSIDVPETAQGSSSVEPPEPVVAVVADNEEPEIGSPADDPEVDAVEELAEPEDGCIPEQPGKLPGTVPMVNLFVPREFLSILNKENIADLKLGDHSKQEMTIFFSDIRQFTDLSEDLTTEESFAFINSYFSRVVPEIIKHGGFVDKYIGDAILALFPRADGADMAVRASISIQEKIQEYNLHRAKCNYRPLSMGIGIHTGSLMVGVVGTEDRMQSTVVSDAVNLASRVESLTKAFRVSLAISEETFKKLDDPGSYQYRFVGKVRVKGKSDPVSIFEIFDGIDEKVQRKKIQANRFFEQGMFLYYQKKYSEALLEFRQVLEILPDDGAAAFYIDNCLSKIK